VNLMRPSVAVAFRDRGWVSIRGQHDEILTHGDVEEIRVLALAHLYTGSVGECLRLLRRIRDQLSGRSRAAALVDGATALALLGSHNEALSWLQMYYEQTERSYDAPALECEAYCCWRLGRPTDQVDHLFVQAIHLWADKTVRVARTALDRARMLAERQQADLAESVLESIADQPGFAGRVTACRAYIAYARGDLSAAKVLAMDALAMIHTEIDEFGSVLREVYRLHLLLAKVSPSHERSMWIGAARAAATVLGDIAMFDEADCVERGAF
jgi:tetratricopeptide (TPR) repeat protein